MARRGTYFLLNVPHQMDMNFNHAPYFKTKTSQLNWFMSKVIRKVDEVQFHRKDFHINVPYFIDDLELANYVITRNEVNGKYYFYFIYDKVYVNDNNTTLILKLDVIQTYMFDINLGAMESLIDRSHVDRFNSDNTPIVQNCEVVEDIEVGEYVEYSRKTVYDYSDKGGYILACSDKLTVKNGGGGQVGGGTGYKEKKISPNCFVFLKGYEAFAPNPYDDGLGYMTIGYGVTELYQNSYYNQLAPQCTEVQASEVLAEMIFNFSSQVYDKFVAYGKDMNTVTQNEFDAFCSLAYNAGVGGMTSSEIFIDYCNGVSKTVIAEKWLTTFINAGSNVEAGLRARRQSESNMFLDGTYEFRPIGIVGGGTVTTNDGKGHIPSSLTPISSDEMADKIVTSARKLIGKPYRWGGNYPPLGNSDGTDCSGLIQWAFNDNGKKISRTTYTQINEGKEIYQGNVQKADLIFSNFSADNTPEHVFLYSGYVNGKHMCIEAQQTGTNIMEREFSFTQGMRIRRLL